MPEILIASLSPIGHIGPLLNVAQGLVDRGDRVTVLSSADHAGKIRAVGATPHAIPAEADFDMTRLDIDLPGRTDTSGIKRVNFDIVRLFVQPMPHQARALSELMARTQYDAVIVDAGFFGILPFLLGDRAVLDGHVPPAEGNHLGAGSGVGQAAVQIAVMHGARVFATAG